MEYRKFGKHDIKVSPLGCGMMRPPMVDEQRVDELETTFMLHEAIDGGINYIDTAYNYKGAQSEIITGKALKGAYRDKVFLSTKSPTWLMRKKSSFTDILDTQLKRLQTDHIDMYMLHCLDSINWKQNILPNDVLEQLDKAKDYGKIRYKGFSFHDNFETFKQIADAKDDWDFCLIQLNYMDENLQAGLEGMKYAADKGMAVLIMEPLRGGYLANVPPAVQQIFAATGKTPVEWALDYLWNMPEISVVLSGMSSMEQLKQNMEYAERAYVGMMGEKEQEVLELVKAAFAAYDTIPCTGCDYCKPICPRNVAIPYCFHAYNNWLISQDLQKEKDLYEHWCSCFGELAQECIACAACEKICPQHLPIISLLEKVKDTFK